MPTIQVNGATLYYEDSGGTDKEPILFAHGFLFNSHMFDDQIAVLRDQYRCVAYDHRGQGQSEVTNDGYELDALMEDALGLIHALDLAPCHYVGLSMGGFVGLRLAARHPEVLQSLTLLETSADPESTRAAIRYKMMGAVSRVFGVRPVLRGIMQSMFAPKFLNDPSRADQRKKWEQHMLSLNLQGALRTLNGMAARESVYEEIKSITMPTLVVVGSDDVPMPPEKAKRLHQAIPNSRLVIIPEAGHTSTIEEPQLVNEAIVSFLHSVATETA